MTGHEVKGKAAPTVATAPAAVEVAFHRLGVVIVTLRGEHDLGRGQALRDALQTAGPQLNVIVDLTECSSVDASFVAALMTAGNDLEERGGALSLVIAPKAASVQRAAKQSGLADALPVYATRSAAIASVRHNEHVIHIRDLRLRFGDPEIRAAECSCGWSGDSHTGRTAERSARREATLHVDGQRGS
jgi:anti-anti-sigma factor